jgi:predicted transcriptional regulator|tara:strand:- start:9846 stop:10148 length:303 start_codon:yes stop_codon:yes gene_type:complete
MTKIINSLKYNELFERKNILNDMKGLSKQQFDRREKLLETYDAIVNLYIKNGECPTIRDLNEPLNVANCAIHKRVEKLTNLSLIYKTKAGQISLYDNPSL